MRENLFRHIRIIALCGLALVALSATTTLLYCANGWDGRIGTGWYLDIVCPREQPRVLYKEDPLVIGMNRIALPGIIGILMLVVSGGLAMLVAVMHPRAPKQDDAPSFDWPGRGNRRRIKERGSHGSGT